jgi:cytoskeletal protein CcmA (bactofilin family)
VVVEAGTRFEGLVSFRGFVRLEGTVVGRVVAEGSLWIGAQAELHGAVEADDVTIEGFCEGEIAARARIELKPTARVRGRLTAPRIAMADGSLFDGRCEAGLDQPASEVEEPLREADLESHRLHPAAPIPA